MPKVKTKKSAAKRFKVTGTGKLKRIFLQKRVLREREILDRQRLQIQQM